MKTYCLVFSLFLVTLPEASSEIKNGYEKEIESIMRSLKGLKNILRDYPDLPLRERRKIQKGLKAMIDYVSYYELTEKLLHEFKSVAPALYNEIDSIKDGLGRPTDVYVKLIPKTQARVQAAGITCLGQQPDDMYAYSSEYGNGTVSVKIWIVAKALWVLAHELGHVKYQVPNLRSYIKFYRNNYLRKASDPNHVGHNHDDPSGKSATMFEMQFHEYYSLHLKAGYKFESPLLLIGAIRKKVRATNVRG